MDDLSLLQQLWIYLDVFSLKIHSICHVIIFSGIFLFVVKWKNAPQWHVTPLWYVGLSSLFIAFSVLCEWIWGLSVPFSYHNLGLIAEIMFDIFLASLVIVFFVTYTKKYLAEKNKPKTVRATRRTKKVTSY